MNAPTYKLQLQIRNVYGRRLIYPMNQQAKLVCRLVNRKTLLETDLANISDLGFEIEWIPETVTESEIINE